MRALRRISNTIWVRPSEPASLKSRGCDLGGDVDDVAHHRHQQLVDAADDLAVDEGLRRGVPELDLDAAFLLQHLDVEIGVLLEHAARIVAEAARGQHGQRAAAQQRVQAGTAGVAQARDLVAGKDVQPAGGRNARADGCGTGLACVGLLMSGSLDACAVDTVRDARMASRKLCRRMLQVKPAFPRAVMASSKKKAGALADAGDGFRKSDDQNVYLSVSIADQRETTRVGLLPASYVCSCCGWKLPLLSVGSEYTY